MEFMIAWYPAAKFFTFLTVLVIFILLLRRKSYKAATAWISIWSIFLYLAPIKIDGTESKKAHRIEVQQATQYHQQISTRTAEVITSKPSFEERMAAEEARSAKANKVVQDEI